MSQNSPCFVPHLRVIVVTGLPVFRLSFAGRSCHRTPRVSSLIAGRSCNRTPRVSSIVSGRSDHITPRVSFLVSDRDCYGLIDRRLRFRAGTLNRIQPDCQVIATVMFLRRSPLCRDAQNGGVGDNVPQRCSSVAPSCQRRVHLQRPPWRRVHGE